jgi:hypothetical protein
MKSSKILYKKHYDIFADYHQFYLMDAEKSPNAPEVYTEEDVRRRIKAENHIVVIQPERNMSVPVDLEVIDSAPDDDFNDWQHVAEASLDLPSGKLRLEDCPNGDVIDEIILTPNSYRIRAYYGDLDKLSFDGLEGDDHYKIVIWQAPFKDVKVLKQYENGRGFE